MPNPEAKAEADKARAAAVREEESVITVRETERAERAKAVELIAAEEAAQKDAISLTVAAEAEKQAAQDRAEAVRIAAEAEAEKQRRTSQRWKPMPKFCWLKRKSNNIKLTPKVPAPSTKLANVLSVEQVEMQVRLALLKHLPDIIRESVRPMEKIEDIKILQVNGLGGFAGGANGAEGASDGQTQ